MQHRRNSIDTIDTIDTIGSVSSVNSIFDRDNISTTQGDFNPFGHRLNFLNVLSILNFLQNIINLLFIGSDLFLQIFYIVIVILTSDECWTCKTTK